MALIWLAAAARATWRRRGTSHDVRAAVEERSHLLYLLASVLPVLNVLFRPLFYLLLQSYVWEWPDVMCIYGVTRVGSGSMNSSRFLPPLLEALQVSKPVLVFLSGSRLVLHVVNRRTGTAPLTGRILAVMLAAGLLAFGDAAAELAYLVIPKTEVFPSVGCCTVLDGNGDPARFVPRSWLGGGSDWRYATYSAVNGVLVLALVAGARACDRRLSTTWLGPLAVAALVGLVVVAAFLVEVAAPRLLHHPRPPLPVSPRRARAAEPDGRSSVRGRGPVRRLGLRRGLARR